MYCTLNSKAEMAQAIEYHFVYQPPNQKVQSHQQNAAKVTVKTWKNNQDKI